MMLKNIPEEYFVVMIRLQEPGFGLYASYSLFHWLPRKSLLSNNQNIKIIWLTPQDCQSWISCRKQMVSKHSDHCLATGFNYSTSLHQWVDKKTKSTIWG